MFRNKNGSAHIETRIAGICVKGSESNYILICEKDVFEFIKALIAADCHLPPALMNTFLLLTE